MTKPLLMNKSCNETTGLRDHGTTGPRDYGTTGLRDYVTTGLRDSGIIPESAARTRLWSRSPVVPWSPSLALLVLGAWCLALPAWGQNGETNGMPPATLERIPAESLNKISLSYRMGLNITVDFKKLGGLAAIGNPGPATGVANRTYDDGSYNRPDVSGSLDGYTWNWGYQNANQIQGNSIIMESSSSPNNAAST